MGGQKAVFLYLQGQGQTDKEGKIHRAYKLKKKKLNIVEKK